MELLTLLNQQKWKEENETFANKEKRKSIYIFSRWSIEFVDFELFFFFLMCLKLLSNEKNKFKNKKEFKRKKEEKETT